MGGPTKAIVAAVALAIAASTAYSLFAAKQKKDQQHAVATALGDTTVQLRKALSTAPSAEVVSRIDNNLKAAKAPRDPQLADAAEHYILGAREIAKRRSDAERLTREAAMSRRALTMHMKAASNRDAYWIRVASDLKKRAERDHFDLETSLKALSYLLDSLPEAEKRLADHVDASLLLEEKELRMARHRAAEAQKLASQELEKVRQLAMPR
jgi:uncharacterized protein (DUF1499 family)